MELRRPRDEGGSLLAVSDVVLAIHGGSDFLPRSETMPRKGGSYRTDLERDPRDGRQVLLRDGGMALDPILPNARGRCVWAFRSLGMDRGRITAGGEVEVAGD